MRTSKHGKGVFAVVGILAHTPIYTFEGVMFKSFEAHMYKKVASHCMQIGEDLFLSPSGGVDDFFNHSCQPNAGFIFKNEKLTLYSLRNIDSEEEVCWDYSTTMNEYGITIFPEWIETCFCGSDSCRIIIKSFNALPKNIQDTYKKLSIIPEYLLL